MNGAGQNNRTRKACEISRESEMHIGSVCCVDGRIQIVFLEGTLMGGVRMRIKRSASLWMVTVLLSFCLGGCATLQSIDDFNTATSFSLANKKIVMANGNSSGAFYLCDDGSLYSPGADIDGGRFVVFQDENSGLVGRNVRSFDSNYFIDTDNRLHFWNNIALATFGYTTPRTIQVIQENVQDALYGHETMAVLSTKGELLAFGRWGEERYSATNPHKIAEDVVFMAGFNDGIIYMKKGESLSVFEAGIEKLPWWWGALSETVSRHSAPEKIELIAQPDAAILQLDQEVWYYGDYEAMIGGEKGEKGCTLLSEHAKQISAIPGAVSIVEEDGKGYLWGSFLSDCERVKEATHSYYERFCFSEQLNYVALDSSQSLLMVYMDGTTGAFRGNDTWGFLGNSSSEEYVCFGQKPVVWVE